MSLKAFLFGLRFSIAISLLVWTVCLFVEHHRLHDRGCLTESAWTTQNDEIYDRELKVD
ncbi:putative conserved membrane protein [Synechococcus sp. RS9907]|nr:putative conserved membrane protein [Synechococcus sp. RS9907]